MSGKKRLRMTLPKRREDVDKVIKEVMELHPELASEMQAGPPEEPITLIEIIDDRLRDIEARLKVLGEELLKVIDVLKVLVALELSRISNTSEAEKLIKQALERLETPAQEQGT